MLAVEALAVAATAATEAPAVVVCSEVCGSKCDSKTRNLRLYRATPWASSIGWQVLTTEVCEIVLTFAVFEGQPSLRVTVTTSFANSDCYHHLLKVFQASLFDSISKYLPAWLRMQPVE